MADEKGDTEKGNGEAPPPVKQPSPAKTATAEGITGTVFYSIFVMLMFKKKLYISRSIFNKT